MRDESIKRLEQAQSLKNSLIIDQSLTSSQEKVFKRQNDLENMIREENPVNLRETDVEDRARH